MLLAVINSCLLLAAVIWLWSSKLFKSSTAVPVVPGLPLIGSVIAVGRGGTAFLTQCRQQVSPRHFFNYNKTSHLETQQLPQMLTCRSMSMCYMASCTAAATVKLARSYRVHHRM
jgi:hypothetical protein